MRALGRASEIPEGHRGEKTLVPTLRVGTVFVPLRGALNGDSRDLFWPVPDGCGVSFSEAAA